MVQVTAKKKGITLAIQLGFLWLFLLAILPMDRLWKLENFDRVVGIATTYGVSVSSRITVMYLLSLAGPVALWGIGRFICQRAAERKKELSSTQWDLSALWSLCGAARMTVLFVSGNAPGWEPNQGDLILVSGACIQLLFLLFGISAGEQLVSFLLPAGLLPVAWALAGVLGWDLPWAASVLIYLVLTLGITAARTWIPALSWDHLWPLSLGGVLISLLYEGRILLAQHGILISLQGRHILMLAFLPVLACGLLFLLKRGEPGEKGTEKIYVFLILGMAMLVGQLPVQLVPPNELFESANTGMAVYQLFQYGEFPIIQNFDAHMLRSFLPAALYRLLSGDALGSLWYGYSVLPLASISLYFFLKKYTPAWAAACLVLFFPWRSDVALAEYYAILLGVFLLLGRYLEQDRLPRHFALWLACGGGILYVLDVGTSVTFGVAAAALVSLVGRQQWRKLGRTLGTGLTSVALVLGSMAALTFYRGVPLISRLKELLATALSSQVWSGATLGEGAGYWTAYLVIPALVVLTAAAVFLEWKRSSFAEPKGGVLFALAVAYLVNFQRSLVRHTAAESYNNLFPLMGTALLFLPLAAVYLWEKGKKNWPGLVLAGGYTLSLVLLTLTGGGTLAWNGSLADGLGSVEQYQEYSAPLTQVRTVLSTETEDCYIPLKTLLDATLEPDQTYIDFTDDTLLYALTGRYKPTYVNQSPGLLNGEYAQQCFIGQCAGADCVYLLTWADFSKGSLDSLSFYQRYYLVGEYLSQNYTPLCTVSRYTVWCRNDLLETQQAKLEGLEGVSSLAEEGEHLHTLRYLPLIWGEEDPLEAEPLMVLQEEGATGVGQAVTAILDLTDRDKAEGNYIQFTLTYTGGEQENISLTLLREGESIAQFQFKVVEGTHRYKIRVSGEPAWYQPGADSLSLLLWGDQTAQVENLQLCRGDTLD